MIFLSCTPREASCHIYDENKLNERLCALENIKKIYEHEVWRVCKNDKIIADYACIENELKKIHDIHSLFVMCLYFEKIKYPTPKDPIYISEEIGVVVSKEYHDYYQYICTLNAHAFIVRELCIKEIEYRALTGNISAQSMMRYINNFIKRPRA